jgi:hypothetical protein
MFRCEIKIKAEMGRACGTHGGDEKFRAYT